MLRCDARSVMMCSPFRGLLSLRNLISHPHDSRSPTPNPTVIPSATFIAMELKRIAKSKQDVSYQIQRWVPWNYSRCFLRSTYPLPALYDLPFLLFFSITSFFLYLVLSFFYCFVQFLRRLLDMLSVTLPAFFIALVLQCCDIFIAFTFIYIILEK